MSPREPTVVQRYVNIIYQTNLFFNRLRKFIYVAMRNELKNNFVGNKSGCIFVVQKTNSMKSGYPQIQKMLKNSIALDLGIKPNTVVPGISIGSQKMLQNDMKGTCYARFTVKGFTNDLWATIVDGTVKSIVDYKEGMIGKIAVDNLAKGAGYKSTVKFKKAVTVEMNKLR